MERIMAHLRGGMVILLYNLNGFEIMDRIHVQVSMCWGQEWREVFHNAGVWPSRRRFIKTPGSPWEQSLQSCQSLHHTGVCQGRERAQLKQRLNYCVNTELLTKKTFQSSAISLPPPSCVLPDAVIKAVGLLYICLLATTCWCRLTRLVTFVPLQRHWASCKGQMGPKTHNTAALTHH